MAKTRLLLLSVILGLLSTCAIAQEHKSNDEKHTFRLETDSSRYGFTTDSLDMKRLGVDVYPGAKIAKDGNNDGKGATLSFEWGRDSAHLYVQKFVTSDSADQVVAFYRKQLAKYGPVVECREGKAVAAVTSELKCEGGKDHSGIELKSGTEQKQHIVGVTPKDGQTEFGVVYLDKSKRGEL